jgi:uncharacterized protein
MCAQFSPEEERLYEKTAHSVLTRLQKTRNPGDLLAVLATAQKHFDRAYDSAPESARASVACRAGCDACCHSLVGVTAHEVLITAQFIQALASPTELAAIIARTAAQRDAFAGRGIEERTALKRPCALLRDGCCSVYEARPEACRSHHSTSAEACRTNLELGREEIGVYVEGVRGRMFAIMLAIDHAAEEGGFDDRTYDFGSALHEALTDSLCAARWTRRQPAFSDACVEV